MPQNPLKNLTLKVEGKKARKEQKKRRELPGSAASEPAAEKPAKQPGLLRRECVRFLRYILLFCKEDMIRSFMMYVSRSFLYFLALTVPVL